MTQQTCSHGLVQRNKLGTALKGGMEVCRGCGLPTSESLSANSTAKTTPVGLNEGPDTRYIPSLTVLGGYGFAHPASTCELWTDDAQVVVSSLRKVIWTCALVDVLNVDVWGAGSTTTGGSMIGGGIGLEGMAIGMGIAALANAMSTKTSIETLLTITASQGEVHFRSSVLLPGDVRILLSPLIGRVIAQRHGRTVSQ